MEVEAIHTGLDERARFVKDAESKLKEEKLAEEAARFVEHDLEGCKRLLRALEREDGRAAGEILQALLRADAQVAGPLRRVGGGAAAEAAEAREA